MTEKTTDISIVIVSYRCLSVLRMSLIALQNAIKNINADVYVVDNASNDGTVDYLKQNFTWVNTIASDENVGFSLANNKALKVCRGRIVLILNPDTIIPSNFLQSIISHFEKNPNAGALGVQMTNGIGEYLKESKRGYPKIFTSFCKLSGLWRLAPHSKYLNSYYIGQYNQNDICKAPILSGACMAFTHELMDRVGMFNSDYFMYGEDIDLSWRCNEASDGNIYRGDLNMIHFKGLCTPRSIKYVYYFHDAMIRFAHEYEMPKHNCLVNAFIFLGIKFGYLLASIKCILINTFRKKNQILHFTNATFVSDNEVNINNFLSSYANRYKIDIASINELPNLQFDKHKAVIFDIDADIDLIISSMKKNKKSTIFGFYSMSEQLAFVYNNSTITLI